MSTFNVRDGVVDDIMTPVVPFGVMVQLGRAPGYSTLDKFGVNALISPATDPEDVIEQGGRIYYPDIGTAPIRYISSSSTSDVGQPILVLGNDINNKQVEQLVYTNGRNSVELEIPLWRQYRMSNESDSLDIQGILYCHADPAPVLGVPDLAITATIINGSHNQTLFTGYTVPAGKVGLLFRGELGLELEGNAGALAEFAHCHYESRRYGKRFKLKKAISLLVGGASNYQDVRTFTDVIPAGTDVKLVVIEVSQDMGLWGTFDILLVDENKFTPERLLEIAQPNA